MNPIRLTRLAVQLAEHAPPGQWVQIEQTKAAALLTISADHTICRLAVDAGPAAEPVEAFTMNAGDLARAGDAVGCGTSSTAIGYPLVVLRISPEVAGIAGPSGTPQTVTISTTTVRVCEAAIDRVEGERASGMTRAVAVVDPRKLTGVVEAAAGMGCTAVTFTFAPRFGSVLAEVEAEGQAATFVIASGISEADAPAIAQPIADDALVFTMPETTARRLTRRRPPVPTEYREEDLPF
ncbi:MAG: hypothetical protein WCO99_05050 [Planctomycetota bacterium]